MAVLGCWSLVLVNNKVATVLRKIKIAIENDVKNCMGIYISLR